MFMLKIKEQSIGLLVKVNSLKLCFLCPVKKVNLDVDDPTKFAIYERYEQQSDLQTHINNPYYKQFGDYVKPLLAKAIVRLHCA